jgi:hypothetical protein
MSQGPKLQLTNPAPTSAAASAMPTFLAIVDRLESAVEAETEALSHNLPADLADLNRRKRQGLFELNRIMRAFAATGPDAEAQARLGGLAAKLEHNRRVLDVQLRAVREIADIIARSMKDAESDGTYSMLAWRS